MASNKEIENIMQSMGWTDGTFIPIANAENKILMDSMQALLAAKDKKTVSAQELEHRVTGLKAHIKNAEQDIQENLKLLDAYRCQTDAEKHMYKIAEYEDSVFVKRIKELQHEFEEMQKHDATTLHEIEKIHLNMDKLSSKIHWMREALDEWTKAMARGDETNKLIAKYCKEDQQKANTFEVKRRLLEANIHKQRDLLISLNEEQASLETVLDKTAELYRQTHLERRQMVDTWKEAVNSMRSRDIEITSMEECIDSAKAISHQRTKEIQEHQEFLDRQIENNKEAELAIADLNNEVTQIRHRLHEESEAVVLDTTEFLSVKKLMHNVANCLQQQRQQNRQKSVEQQEKEKSFENGKIVYENLKKKYDEFVGKNLNAQDRLKHLDELVETEEKILKEIAAETSRLGGALFRAQQILQNCQNDYKLLEMQIKGLESAISSEMSSYKNIRKELARQTEHCYNLEFKIIEIEARIDKMKGSDVHMNPETDLKLDELEKECAEKKHKIQSMKSQIIKVEEDMRQITFAISIAAAELEKIGDTLKEKQLNCEGGEKLLQQTITANQERLVEESILKMRVHQMDTMVQKQEHKVFNLKKHKADLELAMNERIIEIKMQKDVLCIKRKHLLEEIAQLKADVGDRNIKIYALMARYGNALELLGKNEDGSIVTATQIKIETAQEKQVLLREGNELNEKVINAEKDIKAIENTLVLLNYSNETYKRTLEPVNEDNKEATELTKLNAHYCKATVQLKDLKTQHMQCAHEVQQAKDKQDEMEKEFEDVSRFRFDNNDNLIKIHKEILDQQSKMERAQKELKLARRTAKNKVTDKEYFQIFERDLKIKELEERNSTALQQLADMVDSIIGLGPIISKHLYEKGLSIPQPQSSRIRSQASFRSDQSGRCDRDSEYSLKLASNRSSNSSSSSVTNSKLKSTGPSVIQLDFPGNNSDKSTSRGAFSKSSSRLF